MSQIYTFFFNGKEYYTKQPITLIDLISYFNYNSSLFVLEYNNFICNKNEWSNITVKNKDKVEIVTIVGGG